MTRSCSARPPAGLWTSALPLTRVRELIGDPLGFDPALWRQGGELGWYAMLVPEQHGGGSVSGHGLLDAAIVAEELGRMVHPGPFHATNVVAYALAESGTAEQREKYLPAIAGGELIATWAFAEPDRDWKAETVALAAVASGDGYVLDGVKTYVPYAHAADLILVTARTAEGLAQFVVNRASPGVSIEALESLDVARRFSVVRFEGVRVGPESVVGVTSGDRGSGRTPASGGAGAAVRREQRSHRGGLRSDRPVLQGSGGFRPAHRLVPGAEAPDGGSPHVARRVARRHRPTPPTRSRRAGPMLPSRLEWPRPRSGSGAP